MGSTLTYTGLLTTTTCWCGMRHAIPSELYAYNQARHRDGLAQTPVFCPLGHTWVISGESEADKLKRENERLKRVAESRLESLDIVRKQRDDAQRSASAYKGSATKARKRAAAALCPVDNCGRSFVQMRRHLSTKHPDYQPAD